ncbi:MAG: hypothetical protein IV090_24865 [Candidatus Sericytochromatia bacterium]|nr:hypothetical protein [Candidatus Sericytochromatia bacterium]
MKYIIWTLNRASEVLDPHKNQILDIFKQQELDCEFADKGKLFPLPKPRDREKVYPHQLMQDTTQDNQEYYIPIPVKCLGKWIDNPPPGSNQALLNEIKNAYPYFQNPLNPNHWKTYWDQNNFIWNNNADSILAQNLKMCTPQYQGYYELLDHYSQLPGYEGCQHILIGYSQGGLVTRYLAFLDENVFNKDLIAAIFTVASPNYGSPVANTANRDELAEGITGCILAAIGLLTGAKTNMSAQILNMVLNFDPNGNFTTAFAQYIENLILALEKGRLQERNSDVLGQIMKSQDLLMTARKWLTGMVPTTLKTAFDDFDTANLELSPELKPTRPHSVLALVNHHPLERIQYGYLVNTDNDFFKFVTSQFQIPLDLAGLQNEIKKLNSLTLGTLNDKLSGISGLLTTLNIFAEEITDLYKQKIMNEEARLQAYHLDLHAKYPQLAYSRSYQIAAPNTQAGYDRIAGPEKMIPPFSHDFIIPSGHQTLPPSSLCLAAKTMSTNHITGGSVENALPYVDLFQRFVNFQKGIKDKIIYTFKGENLGAFTPEDLQFALPWFKKKLSNSAYYRNILLDNGNLKESSELANHLNMPSNARQGLWRLTHNGLLQFLINSGSSYYFLSCLKISNPPPQQSEHHGLSLGLIGKGFEYDIREMPADLKMADFFEFIDGQNRQYLRDKENGKFELYRA